MMVTTEDSAFRELHLPMLSSTGHTLVFEDELLLTDNLGSGIDTDSLSHFVAPTHPFRVSCSVAAAICASG